MDGKVNLSSARNLCIVSVTLVTGIGGLALDIHGFKLDGVGLCGVLAVLLNLLLPRESASNA
jgi:uracil permease